MGTAAHVKLKWCARCAAWRVGQRLAIRPTKDDVWWTGLTRRVAESVTAWGALNGRWWPWSGVLVVLFVGSGLLLGSVGAAPPANPFRIGVLPDAGGPTPGIVGLRDGLLALGYHEEEQFVMGVRFTQGDVAALPAAARE